MIYYNIIIRVCFKCKLSSFSVNVVSGTWLMIIINVGRFVQVGFGNGAVRGGRQEGSPEEGSPSACRQRLPESHGWAAEETRRPQRCARGASWTAGWVGHCQEGEDGTGTNGELYYEVHFHGTLIILDTPLITYTWMNSKKCHF